MDFVDHAVKYKGDDCLPWPHATNKGHGQVRYNGRTIGAHRLVLMLHSGPPSDPRMEAAHAPLICHNRLCVNPAHLRWATHAENMADTILDGTTQAGERSNLAKLTAENIRFIRSSSLTGPALAEMFGVDPSNVAKIRKRKSWAHLDRDN